MDRELLKKVYSKIDGYRDRMIEMQGKLTEIPAVAPESGGNGEWAKARVIRQDLEKLGLDRIEEFNCPDKRVPEGTRPNFMALLYGKDRSRTVWIMSHIDIVPEGEKGAWKSDPFKIRIEGDKLFGRGTEDNQQAIVSSYFAVKAIKELGIKPAFNLGLIIVSDEETSSNYGIKYVLKNSNAFTKDDLILVPDAGVSDGTMIEVAEKGRFWLKIKTIGKQGHGSMPEKAVNAHRVAAELIVKLNDLYRDFPYSDPVFDPPISTFEPTKKDNNVPNINTIPGDDVFYMDMRILPKYSNEEVYTKIRSYASAIERKHKVKVTFEEIQDEEAAPATPADSQVVKSLQSAIRDVYKVEAKPIGIGGGTVAAYFREAGFHAACWSRLDDVAHQADEYCLISNMIGDTKVFANIFLQ